MSKYDPLQQALLHRDGSNWRVHFDQIEKILGMPLPASARKYPAWWSNDQTSHSHTRAWLRAGWKTAQVDIPGEAVTFRKVTRANTAAMPADKGTGPRHGGKPATQSQGSLHLTGIPQSVMTVLKRRAAAKGTNLESVAKALLERAVEQSDRKAQAASIRAMTPKGQRIDLAALIRSEREKR